MRVEKSKSSGSGKKEEIENEQEEDISCATFAEFIQLLASHVLCKILVLPSRVGWCQGKNMSRHEE